MPPKKIIPKPDIDIVEINQSDFDSEHDEQPEPEEPVKAPRGRPKKDKVNEVNEEPKKKLSQGRLNALAAGRKRAHEKREEKKKQELEALRLQLKKELENEGYVKKEAKVEVPEEIKVITKPKVEDVQPQNENVKPQIESQNKPKNVNRQSRLRIIEESSISQHNGSSGVAGFEIPYVGGIIKKIGRKYN